MSPALIAIALALAAPPAEPPRAVRAATHVIAVPDAAHIVVAHGRRDRFPPSARGLPLSARDLPREDRKTPPVTLGLTIAQADVVRVDETSTLLRLRDVVRAPRIGDHLAWPLELPPRTLARLRSSHVFWLATLDLDVHTLDDRPILSLGDVLADPRAADSRIVDAMLAEIHAQADLARQVYADPIDRGAHRGRRLADIFATTGRDDLVAFFDYILAEPWNYLTWSFRLVEIYATWIVRGAPRGPSLASDPERVIRTLELGHDLRHGRWEDAERALLALLRQSPGDAARASQLEQVAAIRRAEAALARDPGDGSAAWVRARALASLGLYAHAVAAFEAILVREPAHHGAELQLGYALCGAARWSACEDHFAELIRRRGKVRAPDPQLDKWHAYARSRGVQGGNEPSVDAVAHVQTAVVLEEEGAWDLAIASWRSAVLLARQVADPAALDQAERGLARASRRLALIEEVRAGIAALDEHDLDRAARSLAAARAQARLMSEPEAAVIELAALAAAARATSERDFARLVLEARVSDLGTCAGAACKALGGALADLAEHLAEDGEYDRAEAHFAAAVAHAPDDLAARAKRAWFFAERGRWSDAYAASFMGSGQSPAMAWAIVRASVARGRLDEAREYAGRLGRDHPELGLVDAAVHRVARVADALAPDPALDALAPQLAARERLRRIRALAELGLEAVALAELEPLGSFPELLREAAWALARHPAPPRPGVDLFARRERLRLAELANKDVVIPLRARRLAVLRHAQAVAGAPPGALPTARLSLARAHLAAGEFHAAWAEARQSALPASAEHVGRARRGLAADRQLGHARQARARGDAASQRALAAAAQEGYDAAGAPTGSLEATLVRAEAELALRLPDARARAADGLERARRDGDDALVRAFEALLAHHPAPARARGADAATQPASGLERAEATWRRHIERCAELDDDRCLAESQHELGLTLIRQGLVADAFTALDQAIAGLSRVHDRPRVRRATMAKARVHRLRSELALSATQARAVLTAAIADGDGLAEREALLELGSLALAMGDLASARSWLGSALEAAERGQDPLAAARAHAHRGRAEARLAGDHARAVASLERAVAAFDGLGAAGDALEARVDLAEALTAPSAPPPARARLGRALALLTDAPDKAAALGRRALRLRALAALAAVHLAAAEPTRAAPHLAAAEALAAELEHAELAARVAHLRALAELAAAARQSAAEHALYAARRLAPALARGDLPLGRSGTEAVFVLAADLLFEQGRHDDALEVLELQRTAVEARVFDLDKLRRAARGALAADLARYAEARARADAVDARLREVADEPETTHDEVARAALVKLAAASHAELVPLAARLSREHPAHFKALARDPTSLARERKKLPRDTALVGYFVSGDALFLFVVRARAPITALRVAIDPRELAETVTRYKKLLVLDPPAADPLAHALHGWLVAPLEPLIPPAERPTTTVILLPHGPLFDVPFSALVSAPATAGAAPRYAIEDWRFVIASARTLAPLLAGPRKLGVLGPVLGLTDPDGSLPDARRELDRLPDVIPATILRGADATEAHLRALSPAHRILHFATHGRLAANPLDSALTLASGELTVSRIAGLAGLEGKVALVFLSACGSAADAAADPHDAVSLAEGFAMAGVPTLIGSLWDVDDRATRHLVERFYQNLAAGTHDTLGALRAAQLATRDASIDGARPFAQPRYWAAFQLIGDFR